MILVSKTYQEVTPASSEDGEYSDSGFEWEDEPHTFRELVQLMREHTNPSSWPMREAGAHDWFTSEPDTGSRAYFEEGLERSTSIHYSRANDARSLKYWNKAARVAGLLS